MFGASNLAAAGLWRVRGQHGGAASIVIFQWAHTQLGLFAVGNSITLLIIARFLRVRSQLLVRDHALAG
jgi:hypothetical protein